MGCSNCGRPRGICVPLLHSLKGPTMSRNLLYELFYVIYVVHKLLLIHSFTVVIFLKQKLPSSIVPIQMPDHGLVRLALGHYRRPGNGCTQTCLPAAHGVAPPTARYGPASAATTQDPREADNAKTSLGAASLGWLPRS